MFMTHKKIHICTSGWYYQEWKGGFYPKDINPQDFPFFLYETF